MTVATASAPRRARREGSRASWFWYLLLLLGGVLTLAPFYFMFVFATHTRTDIFSLPPPTFFGDNFRDNYEILIGRTPFWRSYWNSIYLTVMGTVTTLFFCSLAGYAFAMYNFKGREFFFNTLLATLLIPNIINLVPFYLIINMLGWINQPRALWVPGMASAFGIFLMRQYIGSAIPKELVEAARIDGATEFGIFTRVILPLCGPALSTLGLVTFIGQWNSFTGPLVILPGIEQRTVQIALRSMQTMANTEWGALMAGVALAVVPLLVVFAIASKQLIEGLTAGSLKG
ncbi:MAG TPA: carbohydrate ABC transporter permease [Deinococcales bacterium]|nr:carbohydrate ABC transporter permease [Deinococcales bacterium]